MCFGRRSGMGSSPLFTTVTWNPITSTVPLEVCSTRNETWLDTEMSRGGSGGLCANAGRANSNHNEIYFLISCAERHGSPSAHFVRRRGATACSAFNVSHGDDETIRNPTLLSVKLGPFQPWFCDEHDPDESLQPPPRYIGVVLLFMPSVIHSLTFPLRSYIPQ